MANSVAPPPVTKTKPPAVTIGPGAPATPSAGRFRSLKAGCLLIAGVWPRGTVQRSSPVAKLIATSVPYGGLLIGSESGRCVLSDGGIVTRSDWADRSAVYSASSESERVGFTILNSEGWFVTLMKIVLVRGSNAPPPQPAPPMEPGITIVPSIEGGVKSGPTRYA